jgi:quercetin dioxygenase-like cupin family protein
VLHPIGDETQLYVLEGAATVGVGGAPTSIRAGDAVSRPDGMLRGDGDATLIAWTVGSAVAAPRPMVVRAEDVTAQMTAEWMEGDTVVRTATTAETEGKAPADAKRLLSRRYTFDGNSIRVAKLLKGGRRAPATMTADSLIYVTGGPLRFRQGDEEMVVNAGDFIREEAGLTHVWDQLEDGGFVTTTGFASGRSGSR